MATGKQLKRSLSLDHGLDGDDLTQSETFKTVIPRKSRRAAAKKAKVSVGNDTVNSVVMELQQDKTTRGSVHHVVGGDNATAQSVGSVSTTPTQILQENSELKKFIEAQKNEIDKLNSTVDALSTKVHFLLSFLGIEDSTNANQTSDSSGVSSGNTVLPLNVSSTLPNPDQPTDPSTVKSGAVQSSSSTFAACLKKTPVYQAVVSSVYNELSERSMRSKNVVVTGFPVPVDPNVTDKVMFSNMCESELGIHISVASCRRLGRSNNNSGMVRPLLVVLSSAVEASNLLSSAKRLRYASDEYTRRCVFINADMTRAEAKAAYDERVRRRQIRESKIAKQQKSGVASSLISHEPVLSAVPGTNVNAPVFLSNSSISTSVPAVTANH